jgi:hypothetical protein
MESHCSLPAAVLLLLLPAANLASYCDATFGQLCVDELEDPACPALFRSDNRWYITSQKAQLCDMTCLTMLCRMQEKAKAEVKGEATCALLIVLVPVHQ